MGPAKPVAIATRSEILRKIRDKAANLGVALPTGQPRPPMTSTARSADQISTADLCARDRRSMPARRVQEADFAAGFDSLPPDALLPEEPLPELLEPESLEPPELLEPPDSPPDDFFVAGLW